MMANSRSFYEIQPGDTLSEVAVRHGTTLEALCKINGIENPDAIESGEVIALNVRSVCKVKVLFIDWDRNPIPDATVRLKYCGKVKTVTSRKNGCLPEILTQGPEDLVEIWIRRYDGSWKRIAKLLSGWGNKLITLRSPKLKITTQTKPHPKDESGRPISDTPDPTAKTIIPPGGPKSTTAEGETQATFGDDKGPKTKEGTTNNGLPITKVTNDQVELDFLKGHSGGALSENDFAAASKELGCEINVIKAIAKVESGGRNGFDKKGRPVILYERHVFSRNSNGKYNKANSDISSNTCYRLKKKSTKALKEDLEKDYYAGSSSENYMRLAKAYALDKNAALMACSWGKFQILGENYSLCKYPSVAAFVADHVRDEAGQLHAFVMFIKSKKLQKALREKDWAEIARGYNGKFYKKFNYDKKLENCYKEISK